MYVRSLILSLSLSHTHAHTDRPTHPQLSTTRNVTAVQLFHFVPCCRQDFLKRHSQTQNAGGHTRDSAQGQGQCADSDSKHYSLQQHRNNSSKYYYYTVTLLLCTNLCSLVSELSMNTLNTSLNSEGFPFAYSHPWQQPTSLGNFSRSSGRVDTVHLFIRSHLRFCMSYRSRLNSVF